MLKTTRRGKKEKEGAIKGRMQKFILYRIGALAVRVRISGYAVHVAIDQQAKTTLTAALIDIIVYLGWHVLMHL